MAERGGRKREREKEKERVGAGVKLAKHLQIGVNYNIPLGKSGDISIGEGISAVFDKYKTKTWQISAAYMF